MADEHQLGREYVLHEEIGRGAQAIVHRATSRVDGVSYAAKSLRPELAGDRHVRDLFLGEEAALRDLQHDHIAGLHDLVVERGRLALLTEYVDGPNLRRHLADRGGRLAVDEAVTVTAQIAAALACAHAQGIVHLDLKPENVLVVRGSRPTTVKLGDFGIGGVLQETAGRGAGTPGYTAPEVARGGPVTTAADVYALGVLLTELLTGHRPAPGGPAPGSTTPELARLVAGCLDDDPRRRPSARSLAAQLRAVTFAAFPSAPNRAHPAAFPNPGGQPDPVAQATRLRRPLRPPAEVPGPASTSRGRRIAIVAGAGAVLLAGAVGAGLAANAATSTAGPVAASSAPVGTAAVTTTTAEPTTTTTASPLATTTLADSSAGVPDRATYAEHLPNGAGTLYIAVRDGKGIAYMCDGKRLEAWFSGTATDGELRLASKKGDILTGAFDAGQATGEVTAGGTTTKFTLPLAGKPAGLFKSLAKVKGARIKGSWIVLADGTEVGVLTVDDVPQPAPSLDVGTGTATVQGETVTATEVDTETGAGF